MSQTAADGGSPLDTLKSGFVLKTLAFVVALIVVGIVAPLVASENEFIGVFVGMVWSIAFLIILVGVVGLAASIIRQALR